MKRMLIFPLLLGLMALTGCNSDRTHASEESFFAMDTVMQFTVYGDDVLLKDAQDVIADIEDKASVTNPDSELYAINRLYLLFSDRYGSGSKCQIHSFQSGCL